MNFNLAQLREMQQLLASVQASNQVVCATYEYDNPLLETKQSCDFFQNNFETVLNKSKEIFTVKLPNYNLENLLVSKLLQNVLDNLKSHASDKKIKIPNGCCSLANCPTKIYYECILKVICNL
jgi:hypothetical protein